MNNKTKLTLTVITAIIIASVVAISPVAAQGDIDTSNLEIGEISAPDEADLGEEVEFGSSAEIPDLPADWSAELEFSLYIDESQVGTQEISIEDGESTDVSISHQMQEDRDKEIYFEISGELTREGALSEQSVDVDRTTQTVTIEVIDDGADDDDSGIIGDDDDDTDDDDSGIIGDDDDGIIDDGPELDSVSVEGAAFVAPDTIQNDIDEVRDNLPEILQNTNVPNAFILASSDQIYVVLTSEVPEEGYASVEGQSIDPETLGVSEIAITGNQGDLNIQPIVADDVEFTPPSEVSVQEVYENTEQYDRQYVEINANHRSIAVDYEETEFAATAGVLVEEPIEAEELFGSVGEQSQTALNDLDGDNIGGVLGDISQARVVTTSYETEYWDNTEVTTQGIVAGPDSPAGEFIQVQQEESILPTDSNTPILYKTETDYETESVGDISEIAANPAAYDGQTVQFETNVYMNTISSKQAIESATGTPLPPVDTILHGGVGWEQLPEGSDDVVGIIAASSIEQTTLSETRDGKYEVTGEVVSTDRIEGDLPGEYILIAYDLERTGSIDTASPANIIEEQSKSVSTVLEQQANPDADVSTSSTDTQPETNEEEATEEEDETDTDTDTTGSNQPETGQEDSGSSESGGVIEDIVEIISGLFGSAYPTTVQ